MSVVNYFWSVLGWVRYRAELALGPARMTLTVWGRTDNYRAANEFFQLVNQMENDGWVDVSRGGQS